MKLRLIEKKAFVFEADHHKAYMKLRERQFPEPWQGLIREPLSNALDEQVNGQPIEITLKKVDNLACLTFRDNGAGLAQTNILALHYIGRSSKRDRMDTCIGRFGMGLIAAFHPQIEVSRVEIRTRVNGVPAHITIDAKDPLRMPQWWMTPGTEPVEGLAISFYFPTRWMVRTRRELTQLLSRMVVPIRFNGDLFHFEPQKFLCQSADLFVSLDGEPQTHYALHYAEAPDFSEDQQDRAFLYLRNMPIENAYLPELIAGRDCQSNLPQNYWAIVYASNDQAIVLSQKCSPTVGRDCLVRDQAFDELKQSIEKARVNALTQLLRGAINGLIPNRDGNLHARNMARANMTALSNMLIARLKDQPLSKPYCLPLVEALLDYPLFKTYGSSQLLSIRSIAGAKVPSGVYAYAANASEIDASPGTYLGPFILMEDRQRDRLWGYHIRADVDGLLKPILIGLDKTEFLHLNGELGFQETKLKNLESRGVIKLAPVMLQNATRVQKHEQAFLDRLRNLLNMGWFRHALDGVYPPVRIHLRPIENTNNPENDGLVACAMRELGTQDEFYIGINLKSQPMQTIIHAPDGEVAFLPILCHELAHRPTGKLGHHDHAFHGNGFQVFRLHLEDRVLKACVRHLLSKDEGNFEQGDWLAHDILVL